MADLTKTVQIIFNGVDNTGGAIASLGKGIDHFAGGVGNILAPLDKMADTVKTIDAALVGLGLALGGAALVKAGEFGDQINEIGSIFGGTGAELAAFRSQIEAYAAGSTQSLETINSAIYEAISAGISYKDSLEFVAQAEKLAVAGKADLDITLKAMIGTMNAYGATSADAGKYSDLFFQTVKLGSTTLPELATSLSQVTSTAAAAQVPIADLMAAVAALTSYGVETPQAMTAIKAALSNIIDPADKAREMSKALGLEFNAQALASKGLSGVLADVYAKTGGNVEQMAKLFGSMEGLKAATALGADSAGVYAKSLKEMANAAGTTATAFDIMKDNFGLVVQNMKNNLDLLLVSIGTPLQDEFKDLGSAVTDVFANLKISVDKGTFQPLFDSLGEVSGDLTAFIAGLAKTLPAALEKVDWSKFTAGLEALSGGIASIFDGLDLDTPEGLADTIQMVVDAIGNLLAAGGGIAESWGDVIDTVILPAVKAFADLSTAASQASGQGLGFADAISAILPAFTGLGNGLTAVGKGMDNLAAVGMAMVFKSLIPAFEALSVAALSRTGIIGLFLLIGEVLGKLIAGEGPMEMASKALYRLATSSDDTAAKVASLQAKAEGGAAGVSELANKSTEAAAELEKTGAATEKAGAATKNWAELQIYAAAKADYLKAVSSGQKDAISAARATLLEAALGAEKYAEAQKLIGDETTKNAGKIKTYTGEVNGQIVTLKGAADAHAAAKPKVADFADAVQAAGTAAQGNTKDLITLSKAVGDFQVQMAKIAADLQGKAIEAKVKLDIADVEAQTKIATALIENIGQTYTADAGLIGDLMGMVVDGYNLADRARIAMAQSANERVEELHDAQMWLIGAQVDYMRAKTAAVASGNPLVTIEANGLKPHLEAIMWEILKEIQVKMAFDGGDMLVGGCSL